VGDRGGDWLRRYLGSAAADGLALGREAKDGGAAALRSEAFMVETDVAMDRALAAAEATDKISTKTMRIQEKREP
jgi:hypothetical protein